MPIYKREIYKIDVRDKIGIYINKKTFQPNLTTISLITSVKKNNKKKSKIVRFGLRKWNYWMFFFKKKND